MDSTIALSRNDGSDALDNACRVSRYLRRLLDAEPQLAERVDLQSAVSARAMRARYEALRASGLAVARALRSLRKEVMIALIARDLGGRANLGEVVAASTALAEIAVAAATQDVHTELAAIYGEPRGEHSGAAQQLHVVGMGKLGGAELNVSSDIDLILIYPEDGETDGARSISNHEFFTRIARRLTAALGEITEDGYVFRVDLRLRPYGESGAVVASFDMLEQYLITQGREWERYAWIKARVLTGERGDELMELVRPFVFRRHLDYSAFESMRDLHRQVRMEVERRDIAENVKLGPGGIREIEFIVQLFQLIRGGRDAALRSQPTLAVLPVLAERRLLDADAVERLTAAYVFLRNLEHRLQYLDDQQTHDLPRSVEDRALVAESMGFPDFGGFETALESHRTHVTRQFNEIFAASSRSKDELCVLWQDAIGDGGDERITELLAQARVRRSVGAPAAAQGDSSERTLPADAGDGSGAFRTHAPARGAGGRRAGESRRDAASHPAAFRKREPARGLSRSARAVSAGACESRGAHEREPLGRAIPDPASDSPG